MLSPALLGNLGAIGLDYVVRQKAQSTHLNWYIVEQLPIIPADTYNSTRFGNKSALEIVTEAVLELTYTAHDMAPFAVDMGYVNEDGSVKPPFVWDEDRRLHLRAKLDALYFHLYGITDRDDVRYIYSTFPIVEREETATWGSYRSRDLCLHYMNALAAGHPDAVIQGTESELWENTNADGRRVQGGTASADWPRPAARPPPCRDKRWGTSPDPWRLSA